MAICKAYRPTGSQLSSDSLELDLPINDHACHDAINQWLLMHAAAAQPAAGSAIKAALLIALIKERGVHRSFQPECS